MTQCTDTVCREEMISGTMKDYFTKSIYLVSSSKVIVRKVRRMLELECGRYRHYKGNEYVVLGVALHSETLEKLVVYRADYGDRGLWVRPLSMFLEMVEISGVQKARFQYLED